MEGLDRWATIPFRMISPQDCFRMNSSSMASTIRHKSIKTLQSAFPRETLLTVGSRGN